MLGQPKSRRMLSLSLLGITLSLWSWTAPGVESGSSLSLPPSPTPVATTVTPTYPAIRIKDNSGEEALKLSGISRKDLLKLANEAFRKTGVNATELSNKSCDDSPVFWTEISALKRDDGVYVGQVHAWITEVATLRRRPETPSLVTTFDKSYPAAAKSPRDFKAQVRKVVDMILFEVQEAPRPEALAQKPAPVSGIR